MAAPDSSPASLQDPEAQIPPTDILLYQNLILFLKEAPRACITGLHTTLDGYLHSMRSDDLVTGIVGSLENRKILLELASKLGLADDLHLQAALRADEEEITKLLVSIFYSKPAEDAVLRLEGNVARAFLDAIQNTLDRGLFVSQEHGYKARRIIRKLSESSDMLPSALFITGVSGREEHPTYGGGYGDIYRASYGNKPVALKRMRHFLRGSGLRRIRLDSTGKLLSGRI